MTKTSRSTREQYGRMYETRSILFVGFGISGVLAGVIGLILSIALWVKDVPYHPGIQWLTIISTLALGMSVGCFLQAGDSRHKVRRFDQEEQWEKIAQYLLKKNRSSVGLVFLWLVIVAMDVLSIIFQMRSSSDSADRSIGSFFRFGNDDYRAILSRGSHVRNSRLNPHNGS